MDRFCFHSKFLECPLRLCVAVGSADSHYAYFDFFNVHCGVSSWVKVFFQLCLRLSSEASIALCPFNPTMSSFGSFVTLPIKALFLPFIKVSKSSLSDSATSIRKRLFDSENNAKSLRITSFLGTLFRSISNP